MNKKDLESFKVGKTTSLKGYTSTSKSFEVAVRFALARVKDYQVSVVIQINFKGSKGLFEMSKGYSAFADEEEVLIQDGLQYLVTAN